MDMENFYIPMRYFNCNKKISGPLVLISGLILSIWANCVLVVAWASHMYGHTEMYLIIINSGYMTHAILSISATVGIIHGIKKRERAFLIPWLALKAFECLALFIGSIVLATGYQNFIGLMPVGILFLLFGFYLTLNVWDAYKNLNPEPSDVNADNLFASVIPDKPPSYDSFTNQPLTT